MQCWVARWRRVPAAKDPPPCCKPHMLWAVLCLQAPTQDDLERLPYCCAAFDEGLRLYGPASVATREAAEPIDLGNGMM